MNIYNNAHSWDFCLRVKKMSKIVFVRKLASVTLKIYV